MEKALLMKMIGIYKPRKKDWMGFDISSKNKLSYIFIENNFWDKFFQDENFDNVALVSKKGIAILNKIKRYYPELYCDYMFMFQIINDMKCPLTFEIQELMNGMLDRLESSLEYSSAVNRYYP